MEKEVIYSLNERDIKGLVGIILLKLIEATLSKESEESLTPESFQNLIIAFLESRAKK